MAMKIDWVYTREIRSFERLITLDIFMRASEYFCTAQVNLEHKSVRI